MSSSSSPAGPPPAPSTRWDPAQYLRFAGHRQRPFDELVTRMGLADPRTVVDLGCGPGTATVTLLDRWPAAQVVGIDSSSDMIQQASALAVPGRLRFEVGDLTSWTPAEPVEAIVSNATLQWVPGHQRLLAGLIDALVPGGVLAFQVPANFDQPVHAELRRLVASGAWTIPTEGVLRADAVLEPGAYLEALWAAGAEDVDVWETTYLQVLTGADAVLDWARGTALRPVLSVLDADGVVSFEEAYGAALRRAYPTDVAGQTVLPFRRIFAVAHRPG